MNTATSDRTNENEIQDQNTQPANLREAVLAHQKESGYIAPSPREMEAIHRAHGATLQAMGHEHEAVLGAVRRKIQEVGVQVQDVRPSFRILDTQIVTKKREHAAQLYGYAIDATPEERAEAVKVYCENQAREVFKSFLVKARGVIESGVTFHNREELLAFFKARENFPTGIHLPRPQNTRGLDRDMLVQFALLSDDGCVMTTEAYKRVEEFLTNAQMQELRDAK